MKISSGRIPRHTHIHTRRRQRGDRMKVRAFLCEEEKHLNSFKVSWHMKQNTPSLQRQTTQGCAEK
jgi:hypothetical protein